MVALINLLPRPVRPEPEPEGNAGVRRKAAEALEAIDSALRKEQ